MQWMKSLFTRCFADRRLMKAVRCRAVLWLSLVVLLTPSCDDSDHINIAIEALKAREKKVAVREAAAKATELEMAEQERLLQQTRTEMEAQRKELDAIKAQLSAEMDKAKNAHAAVLQRERRGPAPKVSADRVIVVDPRSDEVLFEKNPDKRGQVASTQKLLTSLIIAETGKLNEMVTIAKEDSQCPPVRIGLSEGDQYPRRQLLTALLVKSSNDIARALARDNAGSIDAFAIKMNKRAAELGMKNSHFVNPNGLPMDDQYSTARDMARVAKAADLLPDIRQMVSTKYFEFLRPDGKNVMLDNTNRVLRGYPYCDGMKTGYTDEAGYCLVCSGEKDGRRRIVVVLTDTREAVWKDSQALLEWSLKE